MIVLNPNNELRLFSVPALGKKSSVVHFVILRPIDNTAILFP